MTVLAAAAAADYVCAKDAAEAVGLRRAHPASSAYIAGGTALPSTWIAGRPSGLLIDIARLDLGPALRIEGAPGMRRLTISAVAPLETIRSARAVRDAFPILADALGTIAALGIRNLATLGGNLGFSGGDLRPLLLASAATVETTSGPLPMDRWLAGESSTDLVLSVALDEEATPLFYDKVGYRAAFSPSLVTLALSRTSAGTCVAVGGGGNRTGRAAAVENEIAGKRAAEFSIPALEAAFLESGLLGADFLSDARHRARVAARIVKGRLQQLEKERSGAGAGHGHRGRREVAERARGSSQNEAGPNFARLLDTGDWRRRR